MVPLSSNDGVKLDVQIKIDKRALDYFQRIAPNRLTEAREKAVVAAGMVWADETKQITRNEDHIDTGLYVNSIGYSTGVPSNPLYDLDVKRGITTLRVGADVEYAGYLESRFSLMARGLDIAENRMGKVAMTQVKNTLFGGTG